MNDGKQLDVIGIGCAAVDYLGTVDAWPREDTKPEMTEFIMQGGGLVATALVTVARLGGTAQYIGHLGADDFGSFVVREFEKEGVDTSQIERIDGKSALFAFCIVSKLSGKRTIFWSQKGVPEMGADDVRREQIRAARCLHVDGFDMTAALRAAEWAREDEVKVVVDAEILWPRSRDLLDRCDYIVASEDFASGYTGKGHFIDAAHALYDEQSAHDRVKVVIVTAGVRGSYCIWADGTFRCPAFKAEVVDTTGCGDVFHGAFNYGLARGWDLERIVGFGSAVAALKCRALGGRAGIPSLSEVEAFLGSEPETYPIDD